MSAPDRIRSDELVPGDRVWHPFDIVCFTVADKPKQETGLHFEGDSGLRVTGTSDRGETVHVDVAPGYIWFRGPAVAGAEETTAAVDPVSAPTREQLLATARKHMWAAWALSSEELASQAADTLIGLGMLVPEGGAAELVRLRAHIAVLEAQRERRRLELVALRNDALSMRGTLAPNGEDSRVPFVLGETLTPAVEWLVNRVAELEAVEPVVFRAAHDSIVMGYYSTDAEARKHCEANVRQEEPAGSILHMSWSADDIGDDAEYELHITPAKTGGLIRGTGYVVTPIEISAAFDAAADE